MRLASFFQRRLQADLSVEYVGNTPNCRYDSLEGVAEALNKRLEEADECRREAQEEADRAHSKMEQEIDELRERLNSELEVVYTEENSRIQSILANLQKAVAGDSGQEGTSDVPEIVLEARAELTLKQTYQINRKEVQSE